MAGKLTRSGYKQLIKGDVEWLRAQSRSLERDHLVLVAEQSVDAQYPGERVRELEAIIELLFQVTPWIRPSAAHLQSQKSITTESVGEPCSRALDALVAYIDAHPETTLKKGE